MNNFLLKDQHAHAFLKNIAASEIHLPLPNPDYAGTPLTVVHLNLSAPLDRTFNRLTKRATDVLLSSLLILIIFPWLLPLIALAIKLNSKGPVFFLQKRNKINGTVFTCIKFRSMYVNEEADCLPACENDHRITAVGRFLRRHHLDELPQLFNVCAGDMSLIGPRPHMLSDNEKFEELIPHYQFRHKVKPGITGLAQVLGYVGPVADANSMMGRVEKDIYYVRHWSVWLDARIACQTVFRILGRKP